MTPNELWIFLTGAFSGALCITIAFCVYAVKQYGKEG